MLLWGVRHTVCERWVPNQFSHTFHRVSSPKFNFLDNRFPILVLAVPSYLKDLALPLWTPGKAINLLEEAVLTAC
jgi:hypothetical protein